MQAGGAAERQVINLYPTTQPKHNHKKIKKNRYIGYNQTYLTKNTITIAILGIGYADGISRHLSNIGYVFYKNNPYRKFEILTPYEKVADSKGIQEMEGYLSS